MIRILLLFLFPFNYLMAMDCKPEHIDVYRTGYLAFKDLTEKIEDENTTSLLMWWKEGEPEGGCSTQKCINKYFGSQGISQSEMYKKSKSLVRRKKADFYVLVWKDTITQKEDIIPVLKMSLGVKGMPLSSDIAMQYPLTNEKGQSVLPNSVTLLGCGINLLQ